MQLTKTGPIMGQQERFAIHLTQETSPLVSAVLLAAGESRRMGQMKALLDWQGMPLIVHQVRTLLQAGASDVVAVLGHQAQELQSVLAQWKLSEEGSRFRWVVNEDYRSGKIASLQAGLQGVRDSRKAGPILILNVDQPRSVKTIDQVLHAHALGVRRGVLFTIPTCGGRGGHPIVLERGLIPETLALPRDSMGLRLVRARHWAQVQRVELGNGELLWDVNTPTEYRGALAAQSNR